MQWIRNISPSLNPLTMRMELTVTLGVGQLKKSSSSGWREGSLVFYILVRLALFGAKRGETSVTLQRRFAKNEMGWSWLCFQLSLFACVTNLVCLMPLRTPALQNCSNLNHWLLLLGLDKILMLTSTCVNMGNVTRNLLVLSHQRNGWLLCLTSVATNHMKCGSKGKLGFVALLDALFM